jgi:pimeloyl-ACP methyl ester carboxylesterase
MSQSHTRARTGAKGPAARDCEDSPNIPFSLEAEMYNKQSIRRRIALVAVGVAALALTATNTLAAQNDPRRPKPTVVLVHGAFADASTWNGVIDRLQRDGYPVIAPANPLRGIASDATYLASVVKTLPGPVVLVGHSYGGAVIGQAAAGLPNVKSLVFVDAFALDVGEPAGSIGERFPNNLLGPALITRPYALPGGQTGTDVYVQPSRFREVIGADVPEHAIALAAAAQRPVDQSAFVEPPTAAAWKTIPSWFVIGRQDKAIDPAGLRFMAQRAHGRTTEIDASHLGLISHAGTVAQVIERAAR